MDTHLVIALVGRDRPGLINGVSEVVTAGGGDCFCNVEQRYRLPDDEQPGHCDE